MEFHYVWLRTEIKCKVQEMRDKLINSDNCYCTVI